MARYSTAQATPPEPTLEGDSSIRGLNMKLDRSQLEPGFLSRAINNRIRRGVAEPRRGTVLPVAFNILEALGEIRGDGVYSNPNGDEVLLVAVSDGPAGKVYSMRDGTYPAEIAVAAGEGFDGPVEFVQAHDKVFIFRGVDQAQLVWDGVDPAGFVKITKSDPADTSTTLIPPAVTAEPANDRLLIIISPNDVLRSDDLDYTSYDHIDGVFHVGREQGDPIVRVFNYAKALAIVFCKRSSQILGAYAGADPTIHTVEILNSQLGLAGRNAVVMVGADFLFLSEPGGIYRGTQSFENRQEVLMKPLSDPIQPLIDRINWAAAGGATAATLRENVYFAVPIDGATRNNALIVYNGATGSFEGYDTWPAPFAIDDLKITLFQGVRRLFAIDKALGGIYVLEEGRQDFITLGPFVATVRYEIPHLIESRGFATLGWNASTQRDFRRTEIAIATWRPSVTITELTDRAGDERPRNINPITKSRVVYETFGKPDWDPTNVNDDWATPGREDYSIVTSEDGILPGSGLEPDRKQNSVLRFSTKCRARYVSFRIENTQGVVVTSGILVESAGVQRQQRRGA